MSVLCSGNVWFVEDFVEGKSFITIHLGNTDRTKFEISMCFGYNILTQTIVIRDCGPSVEELCD